MSVGRDDVLLKPEIAGFVGEGNASFFDGMLETYEGGAHGVEVTRVAGFFVGARQERDSLPLRQS
jgi:hypothetical protein